MKKIIAEDKYGWPIEVLSESKDKEKYKNDCVEYILEHEYESFLEFLESDSSLTKEEVAEIEKCVVEDAKASKRCISLMLSLSDYHIYASAWLAGWKR